MESVDAFKELALIVGSGAIAAYVALRLNLPTIVGYIFAGLSLTLILPAVGYKSTLESEFIKSIAEVGVALLLFAAGIEFSIKNISKIKKLVILGSFLQTLLVIIFSMFTMQIFGFTRFESIFIGSMVAMSSTAFVLKMLEMREELHTSHGNIMIGWLIMQDILIIGLFLILETIAPGAEGSINNIIVAIFKAALLIGVTYGIGKYIIPPLMAKIAETGSRELLLISILALSIGFAVISESVGVSFTLGSFLTGLTLSETFLKHEIFNEIKPIRDLFTMVFFVSIGSFFRFESLTNNIIPLLGILLLVITFKIIIIFWLSVSNKVHTITSIKIALGLSQIGEFAFLGISIGLRRNWIDSDLYSLILVATVITMTLTPYLYNKSFAVYNLLERNIKEYSPGLYKKLFISLRLLNESMQKDFNNHVVICGFGKVGQNVAKALHMAEIEFIVVEIDAKLIEKAQHLGYSVIYGDSTNIEILQKAEIHDAKVLIVTLPPSTQNDSKTIIRLSKEINPKIKIIFRTREIDRELALDSSIYEIVEPEFEAAVRITSKVSKILEINSLKHINGLRNSRKREIKNMQEENESHTDSVEIDLATS
jgi:CPA2 family monovalent cation:H+ antiporter-2